MRFIAWRGLSDVYRRAVEGHSPWARDAKEPQPICVENVDEADLPETLKATVKAEGIGACAFVPLVAKGELIGKFMTYYEAPHVFSKAEIDLAVTIARQLGFGIERMRAEEALHESKERLAAELDATRQLQNISTQLIHENDTQALYEKILDAAVVIMRSDFASMQMFHPERGELELLAHKGFDPSSVAFWQWVRPGIGCICGAAMASGERAIVPDVEGCDFMAGTESLEAYRKVGMRATGSSHTLGLLDVLARQAADLIERKQTELVDQRLAAIVGSSQDAIVSKDLNGILTSWNDGAQRLFGYAAEEMVGKPILILIPPDHANEEPMILDRVRRGERVEPYETVRRRKDGTLVDISISVSPIKDTSGQVIGVSKIARDITERKLAQERQELLTHEINHRTKNIFALVQAVIARSFAGQEDRQGGGTSSTQSPAFTGSDACDANRQRMAGSRHRRCRANGDEPVCRACHHRGPEHTSRCKSGPKFRTSSARTCHQCSEVRRLIQSIRTRPYQLVSWQAKWTSPVHIPMAGAGWTTREGAISQGLR